MEVSVVYLYQSAKTGDRKRNQMFFDPTVKETGCEKITFDRGMVKVESSKWPEDVFIGLANIRSMNVKKESDHGEGKEPATSAKPAASAKGKQAAASGKANSPKPQAK